MISADSHVVEPEALWEQRLPKALRGRAPRREMRGDQTILHVEGQGPVGFVLQTRDDGTVVDQECVDLDRRIRDIESDGIWAEVVYPNLGLSLYGMPDGDLAMACARVYNDWIAESFAAYSDRFRAVGLVPLHTVEGAVAEIERVAARGLRTVMLPICPPAARPYNLPDYDPLWARLEELAWPVSFHAATGRSRPARATVRMRNQPDPEAPPGASIMRSVVGGQDAANNLAALVGGGVLDRFPELTVVYSETGAGWLAATMVEMDWLVRSYPGEVVPTLSMKPSDYVRRQVHTTFMEEDRASVLNRELVGVGAILWGADYPHREGSWPRAREMVSRLMEGVPEPDQRAILRDNAAALYGFSPSPA